MILAVAGSSSIAISPHFEIVLRLHLKRSIPIVHDGVLHPTDPALRSIDTCVTEVVGRMLPVLMPAVRRPRGRVAHWCTVQRKAGAHTMLLGLHGRT